MCCSCKKISSKIIMSKIPCETKYVMDSFIWKWFEKPMHDRRYNFIKCIFHIKSYFSTFLSPSNWHSALLPSILCWILFPSAFCFANDCAGKCPFHKKKKSTVWVSRMTLYVFFIIVTEQSASLYQCITSLKNETLFICSCFILSIYSSASRLLDFIYVIGIPFNFVDK